VPSGAFWGALMGGIGEGVNKEQTRRRQQDEQARATELALLSKIPMEELDPAMQEQVLRRQLATTYGHLKGNKLNDAIENHPVLNLFRSMQQPRAPEGAGPLESLPSPPSAMDPGTSSQGFLEGGGADVGGADTTGLEPMPVPVSPGAYPAAGAQAPVKMIRASPGAARPRGLFGPSRADIVQLNLEKQLELDERKAKAAAAAKTAERLHLMNEIPKYLSNPDDQEEARFGVITGQIRQRGATRESPLDTNILTVVNPNDPKDRRTVTRKDAIAMGWPAYHAEPRDSAADQRREEGIQQIMTATGMSRGQAEAEYYKRLERKQQMESRNLNARTGFFERSATEPSGGERTTVIEQGNKIAAILKEARDHANKLASTGTPEGIAFYMQNKRMATSADVRQAEQQYAQQALADLGLDPDEVQAALSSMRSRSGPSGTAAPRGGGGRAPNPGWTPR
jgi:hypothetical protein